MSLEQVVARDRQRVARLPRVQGPRHAQCRRAGRRRGARAARGTFEFVDNYAQQDHRPATPFSCRDHHSAASAVRR